MKTKCLTIATLAILCLTSCVTAPEQGYTSLPNDRDFAANYDRIWAAVVSLASEKATVKHRDKAHGFLACEAYRFGSGLLSPVSIKPYAYEPPNFLGTWSDARAQVSFHVTGHGQKTNVRVTAHFSALENNVSHVWEQWPTKGVLEQQILGEIQARIAGGSPASH